MVSWTCKVTWPAILAVLSTSKILWTPSLLLPWAPVYPVTARGCRAPLFAWKTRMDNLIKISVKCASFRSQREMDNFYLFYVYIFYFSAIYDGYPTFVISIVFIGLCTAVIGDVAGHLGCFIYLKDSVNAIAFVALGTSVPGNNKIYYLQICCIFNCPFTCLYF